MKPFFFALNFKTLIGMSNLNQIFQYKGSNITFQKGDNVMINATEMAKSFGKRPAKWLELPSTNDFIRELAPIRKSDRLVETINGIGTWMHEDVALEFARWLSPAFAIWCNDRIKELLQTGVTTIANDDEVILQAMTVLQKRLEESKQRNQLLEQQTKVQEVKIKEDAPKVAFADSVAGSNDSILIGQLAVILKQNGLNIGQNRLFTYLREKGYLCKNGTKRNTPTQKSMDMGLFEVKETAIVTPKGTSLVTFTTKVTGKGQVYFVNKFFNEIEEQEDKQ